MAVFVHRGDQLLLLHRVPEDYWHFVAGALEQGETFAEAAARELKEETGLDARPLDMASTFRENGHAHAIRASVG